MSIIDVNEKEYTEKEIKKVIPKGCYCYKSIGKVDSNGNRKIKLCPFLDWIKRKDIHDFSDFQNTGYCHYLKLGDWFDKENGKENEYIELERYKKGIFVNSKQDGTDLLWDSVKECGINNE